MSIRSSSPVLLVMQLTQDDLRLLVQMKKVFNIP